MYINYKFKSVSSHGEALVSAQVREILRPLCFGTKTAAKITHYANAYKENQVAAATLTMIAKKKTC